MLDGFSKEKSDFLSKKDKSKKGSIDRDIIPLVELINSKNDCYTTSSCAGRIVLLEMESRRKNDCNWIFAKHDKANFREIYDALNDNSNNEQFNKEKFNDSNNNKLKLNKIQNKKINKKNNYEIWFKQQPLILHVACRDVDAAKKLLNIARKIFRRAGIIGITDKKITVEIVGSEHLETIVADKSFIVDEGYLKELIRYANDNFIENKKKIGRFLKLIKSQP